jgi:hypothetical protein
MIEERWVDSASGNDSGDCSYEAPCATLERGVQTLQENERLHVSANPQGYPCGAELEITRSFSIVGHSSQGEYPSFDCKNRTRALTLRVGSKEKIAPFSKLRVELFNFNFLHGFAEQGGALYAQGISLVIEGVTFQSNQARQGGAIAFVEPKRFYDEEQAALVISNSVFVGNRAHDGGAVYLQTSDPHTEANNAEARSDEANSEADSEADSEANSEADSEAKNEAYSEAKNEADSEAKNEEQSEERNLILNPKIGKQKRSVDELEEPEESEEKIEGEINAAPEADAAAEHQLNEFYLRPAPFFCRVELRGNKFRSNTATTNGGAFYSNSSHSHPLLLYAKRNAAVNNTALLGGAMHLALIGGNLSLFELKQNDFSTNQALKGGALYIEIRSNEFITVFVNGSNFYANRAQSSGGGIFASIENSYATNMEVNQSNFEDNSAFDKFYSQGGAISTSISKSSYSHMYIGHSMFEHNNARFMGGAAWLQLHFSNDSWFDVSSAGFIGNTATQGAALATLQSQCERSEVLVQSCSFFNQKAFADGAVFAQLSGASDARFAVHQSSFSSNSASRGAALSIHVVGVVESAVSISESVFNSNNASGAGGAIFGNYIFSARVTTTFENCNFGFNDAYRGGAIAIDANSKSVVWFSFVSNGFYSNEAVSDGGAIVVHLDEDSTANHEFALSSFNFNKGSGNGGAIFVWGTHTITGGISLADCSFESNDAGYAGGGLSTLMESSWGWSTSMERCWFARNSASSGGAFSAQHRQADGCYAIAVNTTFEANRADFDGGAVLFEAMRHSYAISLDVTESKFIENKCPGSPNLRVKADAASRLGINV